MAVIQECVAVLTAITKEPAAKAGAPFSWACIMMSALFGLASANARLWINELFLIPLVFWVDLVLDSGGGVRFWQRSLDVV